MDHERAGFTLVPTHQDGTALSAFAFDRRISRRFQHGRRLGHTFNERGRNDPERPPCKSGHCCVPNSDPNVGFVPAVAQFTNRRCAY